MNKPIVPSNNKNSQVYHSDGTLTDDAIKICKYFKIAPEKIRLR